MKEVYWGKQISRIDSDLLNHHNEFLFLLHSSPSLRLPSPTPVQSLPLLQDTLTTRPLLPTHFFNPFYLLGPGPGDF